MDFELSEEQELLRDGLRELLDRACTIRDVRAIAYDGDGRAARVWRELAGAGWTGVTVPEAYGGMGLDLEALAIVAIEAGRAVLPAPLLPTLVAARAIGASPAASAQAALLAAVANGDASVAIGLAGAPDTFNGHRPGLRAAPQGDGWTLSGPLDLVPFGPFATHLLVDAQADGGERELFVLPATAPGLTWEPVEGFDQTVRLFDLAADSVQLPAGAALGGGEGAIRRLAFEQMAIAAADTLGCAERLLEVAVGYVKERVQFGRPVGANQAVKVRVADMGGATERMRAAVYYAALALESGSEEAELAVHMARAASAAPGAFVGTQGIHVHGGIGYTWDHDAQIYFKRLKANELLYGDTTASLARVAALVV